MKIRIAMLVAALALLAGCGQKSEQPASTPAATETPAATPATPDSAPAAVNVPAVSPYDSGPRAGESAVNAAQAAAGEKLFQTKGCFTCHTYGKKALGPDLTGASMRRTAEWMKQQILHPEKMVVEDPIAIELRKGYSLVMTNQGLKEEEALAVIEFLKKKDRDLGIKAAK